MLPRVRERVTLEGIKDKKMPLDEIWLNKEQVCQEKLMKLTLSR